MVKLDYTETQNDKEPLQNKKEHPSWMSNLILVACGIILIFMLVVSIKLKIKMAKDKNNVIEDTKEETTVGETETKENTEIYDNLTNQSMIIDTTDNEQIIISRGGFVRTTEPLITRLVHNFKVNGETVLCIDDYNVATEKRDYLLNNTEGLSIEIEDIPLIDGVEVSNEETINNVVDNYVREYQEQKAKEEAEEEARKQAERNKTCFPTISHYISSTYGYRSRGDFHTGIDLAGAYGDNIYAYKSGVVEKTQYSNVSYGNMILIRHYDGTKTRYAHLSSILVSVGQEVSCGELIGKMGSTGNSTGNHLHFEVIINDSTVNPYNYIF